MITIFTEILPEGWRWNPHAPPPSGSVEFYIATAEELAKRHDVQIFYDGEATEKNGVYYLPRELYEPSEINIHCNDRAELGKWNIYWTNKVGQKAKDYMDYDHRITLSKYHKSIFGDSVIIGHGIYKESFKPDKKENLCLYSSSPDGIWKLKDFPFEKYGYSFIQTYNNKYSEEDMIALYKKARFWLHPGQRYELFCISAVKAQASGCIPVVVPNQALAETVKTGIKCNLENYEQELIKALENPPEVKKYEAPSWVKVTASIESLF